MQRDVRARRGAGCLSTHRQRTNPLRIRLHHAAADRRAAVAPRDPRMITIDQDAGTITVDGKTLPMASAEAFRILSDAWIDAALRVKHPYTFTWLGRPVIQFADDLLRLQEIVYRVQPDVIVETGIAHGGSLIFHASLCKLLGHGRVIGIDVEIRPHNRAAIEAHPLAPFITMFEGSSIDPAIIRAVKAAIAPDE